jgi:hypothetical protein
LKKILTTLALLTFSLSIFGQKQDIGDIPIEVEFSPLGANPLKISNLRTRYFKSNNFAYRMGFFVGGSRKPSFTETNNVTLVNRATNFNFNIRPGFEKHFEGTKRLSPYIGSELSYSYNNDITATESIWTSNNNQIKTQKNRSSNSIFGINVLTGADFYISDKIFLGIEIGFGIQYDGRGKTSTKWKNPESNSDTNTKEIGNSSSFQWGPNYQGTIRLGYCLKTVKK